MPSTSKVNLSAKVLKKNPSAGLGDLHFARFIWNFAKDGGTIGTITPNKTATLPKNAVIVAGTINSTTACVGATGTFSVGTDAGSSTTALLAATAVASLSSNALINAVPVFATPVKLTAQGTITVSIATANFTAGVVEGTFLYYVANA